MEAERLINAALVNANDSLCVLGDLGVGGAIPDSGGVRPAMWIDLNP